MMNLEVSYLNNIRHKIKIKEENKYTSFVLNEKIRLINFGCVEDKRILLEGFEFQKSIDFTIDLNFL